MFSIFPPSWLEIEEIWLHTLTPLFCLWCCTLAYLDPHPNPLFLDQDLNLSIRPHNFGTARPNKKYTYTRASFERGNCSDFSGTPAVFAWCAASIPEIGSHAPLAEKNERRKKEAVKRRRPREISYHTIFTKMCGIFTHLMAHISKLKLIVKYVSALAVRVRNNWSSHSPGRLRFASIYLLSFVTAITASLWLIGTDIPLTRLASLPSCPSGVTCVSGAEWK